MTSQNDKYTRNEILDLQNMLYTVSRFQNGVPDVIPDGVFGHRTAQAISKFQQSAQISPSGIADRETWRALSKKYREVLEKKREATAVKLFRDDVKKGEKHSSVLFVQMFFNNLSDDNVAFERGEISGVLDDKTHRNLRKFQKISNLDPHGDIDRDTWERIASYHNSFIY